MRHRTELPAKAKRANTVNNVNLSMTSDNYIQPHNVLIF
jgi:hypothetical protein